MSKFSLKIQDKLLEKKYKFSSKLKAIKIARVCSILTFLVLILNSVDYFINSKSGIEGILRIIFLIITIFLILFMFTEKFDQYFYFFMINLLVLIMIIKGLFDWNRYKIEVAYSSIVVTSIATFNINLNVIPIFFLNSIYFLQNVIRFKIIFFFKT